jgi:putative long chain acyl-CoA synthase
MLDPIKTAQSRLDFLRQLHDREALLPREQQRRFLASEGWIAWSGPAIAGTAQAVHRAQPHDDRRFSIHGELVTLSDINCPVLAVVGEVDDIGQPASVRGIKRAAPQGRRLRIPHPRRPFRSLSWDQGGYPDVADRWPSG